MGTFGASVSLHLRYKASTDCMGSRNGSAEVVGCCNDKVGHEVGSKGQTDTVPADFLLHPRYGVSTECVCRGNGEAEAVGCHNDKVWVVGERKGIRNERWGLDRRYGAVVGEQRHLPPFYHSV